MSVGESDKGAVSDREKWAADLRLRIMEFKLKKREQATRANETALRQKEFERTRWTNPLVVAILAAAIAGILNLIAVSVNDFMQRGIEAQKAESARILEMIKTDNTEQAATNLGFLLDTGLVANSELVGNIETYLETHPAPVLPAVGNSQLNCDFFNNIEDTNSTPLRGVKLPPTKKCMFRTSHGFPIPDPDCTPGAVHSEVTANILSDLQFRTACLRNRTSTPSDKAVTYSWYGLDRPKENVGAKMTCELDHLIPLGLGGSDTLENIWPQCGPLNVPMSERYFKLKDLVENFLTKQVKEGKMALVDAQKGIANDWPQYLEQARAPR